MPNNPVGRSTINASSGTGESGSTLIVAFQKQLGPVLIKKKAPVDTIVGDYY
jgi:hypothetical protein